MTVQELIERLQSLPSSALSAQAVVGVVDFDDDPMTVDIAEVKYEHGEVVLETDDY